MKTLRISIVVLVGVVGLTLFGPEPVHSQDLTTSLVRFFDNIRAGFLTLPPKTSAPTGMGEGAIYYNDTTNALNVYNGSAWAGVGASFPLQATADGGNNTPQFSFANYTTSGLYVSFGEPVMTSGGVNVQKWGGGGNVDFMSDAASLRMGSSSDMAISRVAAGEFGLTAVAFASLGTPANGTFAYCSDCTFANPCAGSGTGAFAKRLNGAWRCD